jgi:hypothetical protein
LELAIGAVAQVPTQWSDVAAVAVREERTRRQKRRGRNILIRRVIVILVALFLHDTMVSLFCGDGALTYSGEGCLNRSGRCSKMHCQRESGGKN